MNRKDIFYGGSIERLAEYKVTDDRQEYRKRQVGTGGDPGG